MTRVLGLIGINGVCGLVSASALAQAVANDEPSPPAGVPAQAEATPVSSAPKQTAGTPAANAAASTESTALELDGENTGSPEPALAERPAKEDIRLADANVDRVVLMPTAETHPQGRLYFSAHELIFWQLGYSFTDRVQATVTTWPVIVKDQPFFLDASVKANLYRGDVLRLAAFGGLTYVAQTEGDTDAVSAGRFGMVGQFCFTPRCWTSLSSAVSAWFPLSHGEGTVFIGNLGLTSKLSKYVGLLLEVNTAAHYENDFEFAEGALVNYGLRFSGSNIGVDLAMMKPTFADEDELVMGIPYLSFTYRTDRLTGMD